MMRLYRSIVLLIGIACSFQAQAIGEQLIDAVIRSDFLFDRGISNVPFLPLGFIQYSSQSSLNIDGACVDTDCSFDYQSVSEGFGMPVWVSKKHMLIVGQTMGYDEIQYGGENIEVSSGGLLGAWVSQPSDKWQLGSFIYAFGELDGSSSRNGNDGSIAGLVTRYRHSARFHSYWGLVSMEENSSATIYPYAGFDWYIGKEWSVSALLPWPTINYAPNKNQMLKIGAIPAGSQWLVDGDGQVSSNSFSKVDFGLAAERRIYGMFWGELALGYSGFGKIIIESDSEIKFEENVSSSPFVRFSINLRPES